MYRHQLVIINNEILSYLGLDNVSMVSLSGQRYAPTEIILANLERIMLIIFWLLQQHPFWQMVGCVSDQSLSLVMKGKKEQQQCFSISATLRHVDWLWNSGS